MFRLCTARPALVLCALGVLGGLPGHTAYAAVRPPLTAPAGDAAEDGQAAHLAEQLRRNPVHLSDQLPRTAPLSSAPAFEKQAARTGVPTYVLVLPTGATVESGELLASVHDHLGRDGLYVLLGEAGYDMDAETFGVDLPADDAARAVLYEHSYDADALQTFTRFVDVVTLDPADAAARAREASRGGAGGESEPLHTTAADRDAQSRLTGQLLAGVPLLIVLAGWSVHRWRGRLGDRAEETPAGHRRRTAAALLLPPAARPRDRPRPLASPRPPGRAGGRRVPEVRRRGRAPPRTRDPHGPARGA